MKLYTPPANTVLKRATVCLNGTSPMSSVRLMQYDRQIPVLAVQIVSAGRPYTVPEGGEVSLRMEKPDGKLVLISALGVNAKGRTVYFEITRQMTAACGQGQAAVEIREDQGILGVGLIAFDIQKNPVPTDAILSEDAFPAVEKLLRDTEAAADRATRTAQDVEQKLASGAFQGEPGPRGEPGPAGKDGAVAFSELTQDQRASLRGEPGKDGLPGKDGAPGKEGPPGRDGAPGKEGPPGRDGAPGKEGPPGKDGAPGKEGPPGRDGAPGKEGPPGRDAEPPVVARDLRIPVSAWSTYSPDDPGEQILQTGGYCYRALGEIPGVGETMIPCVTLAAPGTAGLQLSGLTRCCGRGVYLYARSVPGAEVKILTAECRRGAVS